jgi:lysozyme family protein
MADFQISLQIVLLHEGGISNVAADKGGVTNSGISSQLLASYLKQPVSTNQIIALSPDTISDIYRKLFWDEMNLSSLRDQNLATVLFDLAVLMGVPRVVCFVQEVLNLHPDGILGSHTVSSINQFVSAEWLACEVIFQAQIRFGEDCVRDQSQLEFIDGWLKRSQNLLGLVIQHS